ncbi:MAG: hypothetical protein M3Z25_12220 [Actinomycetota bacterium]|nr:hypothetical protein [Actinomycetota bacterium]
MTLHTAAHNQPHPAEPGVLNLGEQAAEAIRELNHRTRHHDALADPAELSWLLADLAATANRLPQLLDQLRTWLHHEHDTDRLRADTDTDPADLIALTDAQLNCARRHARHLAAAIETAHQHTAHLATA